MVLAGDGARACATDDWLAVSKRFNDCLCCEGGALWLMVHSCLKKDQWLIDVGGDVARGVDRTIYHAAMREWEEERMSNDDYEWNRFSL